jgi:hypothetical protein
MKYLKSVVVKHNSSMYILRLQRMLDEGQGKFNDKVRPYTARCQRNVEGLSKIGLNPEEISYSLDLPISFVKSRMAKIGREKIERDRFQRTGIIPAFEIISKLSDFTMIAKV